VAVLGCPITYGVFNNDRRWADTSEAVYLFWSPKDNAKFYRHRLDKDMDQPPSTSDCF
jgi:uronate dehydrogenase|tara:strand:+ start:81 stop:254 length:174 start_codon:yes stop_codon:yes gene_type:complete